MNRAAQEGRAVDSERLRETLGHNIEAVEHQIQAACERAGRDRSEVTLVVVTKSAPDEAVRLLPTFGLFDLGESRPQQLWRRSSLLPDTIRWHLIGHLQRNKVERTLPLVHLTHSVDRLSLLKALEAAGGPCGRPIDVLLEVNTSGETAKHGFNPEEVPNLAATLRALRCVRVRGLMTMAAYEENPEACRPSFSLLRHLRDQLQQTLGDAHSLKHLSMGMSNDYEVAIEEGATLVRIGTAVFENLAE
jgi:PLP dependent protein